MSEPETPPWPLSISRDSQDDEAIIAQLKAVLLAKDMRIEQLELAKQHLEDQLAATSRQIGTAVLAQSPRAEPAVLEREVGQVFPPPVVAVPRVEAEAPTTSTAPAPRRNDWPLPITSAFVRTIAPTHGFHSDRWTEPHFSAALMSERALVECSLEMWLKPDSEAKIAQVSIKMNGEEQHHVQLKIGRPNTIKFPIEVAARTIFKLEIICDYVKPREPPDQRRLSYILRSLAFV